MLADTGAQAVLMPNKIKENYDLNIVSNVRFLRKNVMKYTIVSLLNITYSQLLTWEKH